MTRAHWRYILLEQGLAASVINVLINGAIAWLLFRGVTTIPLWGAQSIAGDIVCTCFLLPFIMSLIVTRLARGEVRRGRFAPVEAPSGRLLTRLPASVRLRSLVFGLAAAAVVSPLAIGALMLLGVADLEFGSFVTAKAVFAGVLAAVAAPIIALAALQDRPAERVETP